MEPAAIDILMSTYNGEKHLGEQIDSLFRQTFGGWRLLVRDDGSTDATPDILREYARRFPERILFPEAGENLGARESFSRLAERSAASHVMFCDQDDVWLPEKVGISMRNIRELENRFGEGVPILVFTDMTVVDEALRVIADSFREYSGLFPRNATLNKLLLRNVAAGCSMIVNRALLALALPFPPGAVMHDYWLMLAAAAFGKIGWSDGKTVLYRQHPGNRLGACREETPALLPILSSFGRDLVVGRQRRGDIGPYVRQAETFYEVFQDRLGPREKNMIRDFIRLDRCSYAGRACTILRHGILPYGTIENLLFLLTP